MNIFATHKDPVKAANWLWELDKVRGRKMIVESAQLLSYWVWRDYPKMAELGYKKGFVYKYHKGYVNSMFTIWLSKSTANVSWLYRYGIELLRLYGKPHKSEKIYWYVRGFLLFTYSYTDNITPFVHYARAKSKPELSIYPKDIPNVHKAYRKYLYNQVHGLNKVIE